MRVFLSVLILIFSLQSLTKADDIRDFEIEGMSIGDSLLDFFSLDKIKNGIAKNHIYKDDTFLDIEIYNQESFQKYQNVSFSVKKNDEFFKIYQIVGFDFYNDNVQECMNKVDEVSNEISNILDGTNKTISTEPHPDDPSGNFKQILFLHSSGSMFVECYDWSDKITNENGWTDNFSVGLATSEYDEWLNTKAY